MTQKIALPASILALASLFFLWQANINAREGGESNEPIPLPHEDSDIATDAAVTWGVLENGLRYAILPNEEPPNRVSMRLFVDAGSLMEADNQQGLAHFLEHMAFNGTTNFPAGEMVEYFQRLGMGFGNHTNAHTSFNETVYKLELPNAEAEIIDEGMKLLRDYADGMLFLPDEIEDERGVILSEKRTRDSVSWRTFVEQIKFAFPEIRVSSRMPIGTEEVISNAPRERFVEFYENWYTPNRMAVIVVGDIEVAAIEETLSKYFAGLPAREKRPAPPMGEITKRGLAAHYHYEEEAGETSVSIEATMPRVNPPDNQARREADLKLMLASRMMNRRLERIAKKEDSPISAGNMHAGDFYDLGFALYSSISADCKPENWKPALTLIEQELRRALEFGFTESEFEESKALINRLYEDAAKQMGTRQSRDLANEIARRIGNRRIFTSPAEDLPRVQKALESISPESCRESLVGLWSNANETLLYLSGNAEVDEAITSLTSAYEASQEIAVAPPEDTEVSEFAYADLPDPGIVAEQNEVEDIEVTQLKFENNVRANLKVTDFEDDTIYVKARFGAGLLSESQPGLSFLLSSIFTKGGLEAHSEDELTQLFAGEAASVNFGIDDDAFTLSGQTNPDDLLAQLTMMRAYITNPGFREEATGEFQRALDYIYQQLERTPGGYAQDEVALFLHSGDKRFGYPPRDIVEALTTEDAKNWIMPDLKEGYLEISVVGSFDKEATTNALASTFGSLPERAAEKPAYTEERLVKFPAGTTKLFEFDSEIPKAMAVVHWPTTDIYDIEKSRRLGMLSSILSDRLRIKIREELGDAYSPFAHNLPSDTWTDYGYLFASVTIDPDQGESVTQVISQIAEDLASGESITEDELERAKKPQVTQIEEMRRTNRYWLGSVLESSQEYPERLEWSRTFVDDYRNITVEEVNLLAKEYLKEEAQVSIIVRPAVTEEE
ncbi:MAG: insulinase family protein [Verrucomicrobiales bacterium]|nr:insulinase family protein [Verrucomicrobiales bacterium]